MGRVDVRAQPEARVGEPELDLGHRRGEPARMAPSAGLTGPLAVRARACAPSSRRRASHGSASAWSWLPGHEDERPARERLAERVDQRRGHLQRLGERALAQLERVAEQHDPVGAAERLDQPLAHVRVARDVGAAERAEVQVRDDRRPHSRDGGSRVTGWGRGQLDFSAVPTFCRHNRFTADCPICSKGTVLDPNLKPARPRRTTSSGARKGGAARSSASGRRAARVSRGEFASAGPIRGRPRGPAREGARRPAARRLARRPARA